MSSDSRSMLNDGELHPSYTVSDARSQLPSLVQSVDVHPGLVITVNRRHQPAALLVSQRQYGPIIEGMEHDRLKPALALIVAKKWLGTSDIPAHIFTPQIYELMNLDEEQLLALRKYDPDTMGDEISKNTGLDITVIERLAKRRKVCLAIAQAYHENLYEVAEHLADSKEI